MRHRVLIDEFHLGLYVPRRLSPAEAAAVRRALGRRDLRAALLRSARAALRRHRVPASVTVTLTR